MNSQTIPDPDFFVGRIPIYGNVILAPMDGYSDWPFRSLCRELGSAISYTEFINVNDILELPEKIKPKMVFTESERPVAIQIYGDEPNRILNAALRVQELGPDFIDFNMGCPSGSIANRGAGAGLMRNPLKVARIFRMLSTRLEVPITGKIRLGWDQDCLTYKLVSRIVEENGGMALAIHARTKTQGNRGPVDWDAIAEVVTMLKIPVIGNGGVDAAEDLQKMMNHTGCSAVMVGRAAVYNPWIFSGLEREGILISQVQEMILTHLDRNLGFYGSELGFRLFRKFVARYLSPYNLPREFRVKLLTSGNRTEFQSLLNEIELHQGR